MANKDQKQRGNREARKPKKEKPKVTAAASPFANSTSTPSKGGKKG